MTSRQVNYWRKDLGLLRASAFEPGEPLQRAWGGRRESPIYDALDLAVARLLKSLLDAGVTPGDLHQNLRQKAYGVIPLWEALPSMPDDLAPDQPWGTTTLVLSRDRQKVLVVEVAAFTAPGGLVRFESRVLPRQSVTVSWVEEVLLANGTDKRIDDESRQILLRLAAEGIARRMLG